MGHSLFYAVEFFMRRFFPHLMLAALLAFPVPAKAQLLEEAAAACTRELKICPDGTGVGRIGPNCEFAPCPGSSPSHAPEHSPGHSGSARPQPMPPEPMPPVDPPDRMCTMDAKICPDGSAVGRTGPNCEFAPCPGEGEQDPPDAPDMLEEEYDDGQEEGWVY